MINADTIDLHLRSQAPGSVTLMLVPPEWGKTTAALELCARAGQALYVTERADAAKRVMHRHPGLSAVSINGMVPAERVDLMVFDDVQTLLSLGRSEEILNRMRQGFLPRLRRDGRALVIGTPVADGDIYEEMVSLGVDERIHDGLVVIPGDNERARALVGAKVFDRAYRMLPFLRSA